MPFHSCCHREDGLRASLNLMKTSAEGKWRKGYSMEAEKSRTCLVGGEETIVTALKSKWTDLMGQKTRQMVESQIILERGQYHAGEFGYFSIGSPLHFGDIK